MQYRLYIFVCQLAGQVVQLLQLGEEEVVESDVEEVSLATTNDPQPLGETRFILTHTEGKWPSMYQLYIN